MSKSEYATFLMNGKSNGQPVSEAELKEVASRLATALKNRNFRAGEVFGSSTDLWGFAVATDVCEILVDITPPQNTFDERWVIQALLVDPGWFRATREKRLAELKRVEWGIHEALSRDLHAEDVGWLLGDGRIRDRARQPTP